MIKISTKGRYAARIMIYLALHSSDNTPAQKQKIAESENISPDYVEQLLLKLRTAGLVKSHRGVKGGFTLARPAELITIADVISATEGPLSLVSCSDEKCNRTADCVTKPIWDAATYAIQKIFSSARIADLAEQARIVPDSKSLTFEI